MKNLRITCTGNYRKPKFLKIVNMVCQYFDESQYKVKIVLTNEFKGKKKFKNLNQDIEIDSFENCIDNTDCILSIGGDGTILSTVRRLGKKKIPILGIHIGHLGFLAQSTEKNLKEALQCLAENQYRIDKRIILEVAIDNKTVSYAFNDVVIDHGSSGRILRSQVYINKKHINNYESDGIVVSTPTGSTGYSLSAGGPIVSQNLDVINLTPVSSHSLSARPIVLSSLSEIDVKFNRRFTDGALTIDGQERFDLKKHNTVSIKKAKHKAHLIILPNYDYMVTLKEKLHWS